MVEKVSSIKYFFRESGEGNNVLKRTIIGIIRETYEKMDSLYSYVPNDLRLYESILNRNLSKGYNHIVMSDIPNNVSTKKPNILLRHDVDSDHKETILRMAEIEKQFGIRSSIQIRVDGLAYDPVSFKSLVKKLYNLGFEIGLHSFCYSHKRYMKRFDWEVQTFNDIFGFNPQCFSQHGIGSMVERRKAFNMKVRDAKKRNNIPVSDCGGHDINYILKLQDCNMRKGEKKHHITNHFVEIPKIPFSKGRVILMMTHPKKWK